VSRVAFTPDAIAGRGALRAPWPAVTAAAALSFFAAWVHVASFESHWDQWWGYGVFFLATGVGQGLFAVALVQWPRPWLAITGIAGNLAIVGTYVMTRTEGIPIGTHEGAAERAGRMDLACTAAEIVLVGVLLTLTGPVARRRTFNALLALGALLWTLRLTGLLP
jgi:hypothetical protein